MPGADVKTRRDIVQPNVFKVFITISWEVSLHGPKKVREEKETGSDRTLVDACPQSGSVMPLFSIFGVRYQNRFVLGKSREYFVTDCISFVQLVF